MNSLHRIRVLSAFLSLAAITLLLPGHAHAALVGPAGYTNSFDTRPPAEDWATVGRAGASNDSYDMDTDVNTNANGTASAVTNQVSLSAANPPNFSALAAWSSTGLYLQTRASGGRYTVLIGKFVNDTRSNATEIAISYTLTFAGNPALEDAGKGTRVYYSFTGETNSWINLEAFNTTATNGVYNLSTNLAVNWPYGTNLFVMWVDDNAVPNDVGNQIDNFSLRVSAGFAPPVYARLDAPTNNAILFADVPTIGTVFATNGTPPYLVRFWTNSGAGNTAFQSAGTTASLPYDFNVGALKPGTYNLYATATDEGGTGSTFVTATNTFSVVNARVTLTNPTNNQNAIFGQPFTLAATVAVDPSVTVNNVEFFYDGASLLVDTAPPYAATIAEPVLGGHTVYVVVHDSAGRVTYSKTNQVTFVVDNLANNNFVNRYTLGTPASVTGDNTGANNEGGEPTFQFGGGQPLVLWGATLWWEWIAPFNGTVTIDTFGSSINTVLSVYTGTSVGALSLVQRNDNAPGFSDASLVSFTAIAGTEYEIQVGGQGGFGSPVAQGVFQLNLSMPPYVAITNPAPGSTYLVGDNIPVDVIASSGAGTVTNVSFYDGSTLIGSATNSPYSFVVSNAPAGSNSFYAVAIDTIGQVGTSVVVRVLVANLGITIVSPQDGALVADTNPLPVSVFGLLPAGTITSVDFFVDGQLFGQSVTPPFNAVWSNVTGGSHRVTATGMDNLGNSYSAAAVNFAVGEVLVRSNSVWKYLDNGSNQSNAWIAVDFDDSSWASGPAELGYGDGDEATVVASGPANDFYITTYFRSSFVVTNIASLTNMILSVEYDDAAAVYLNGHEIYRINIPADANYLTTATGGAIEDTLGVVTVSATNLVEGNNVLAVEIHQQGATSSDISFNLDLVGVPIVVRNISPLVAITNLVNEQYFIAPPSVTIAATASDEDGTVSKVEFYADGVKIGETNNTPYHFVWNNPPVGDHTFVAVATDNQGARGASAPVLVVVYDAAAHPVVRISSPANGAVMEGPTNLLFNATAHAINGVTNVQFIANGSVFGEDATAPYAALWPSIFLSNNFVAVVFDANGVRATSAPVNLTITIPPTNTVPPMVATQFPPASAMITNLTNITIVFSERVHGVDAADLLINGVPATSVTGSGSNYTFYFPHPAYGIVQVGFATEHNIFDFGYPLDLALNEFASSSLWQYDLFDRTPPRVASHVPATGAAVTNLTVVEVAFSEEVSGVEAADLLVNGTPAYNVTGSGSNYVFNVFQPASGLVSITWATNNEIYDFAVAPNAFVRNAAGNTWNFTLDARTVLIQSNSVWKYVKGLSEASNPTNAWRQPGFNDSGWTNGSAPFVFGEPTFTNSVIPGTDLSDMTNNAYSSVYLRQQFVLSSLHGVTNVILNHQSDDGFIAWLNGVEVFRFNMPTGDIPYNGSARTAASESGGNSGAPYIAASLTNALSVLTLGTNVFTVHAFNVVTNPASSDFVFNAQLYTYITDLSVVPPRIVQTDPVPGDVFSLAGVTVIFSEEVTNVQASDLLVNGVPASSVINNTNMAFTFSFPQPPFGPVVINWATNHGIVDFDSPPKPFDATLANATLRYALVNSNAPVIFSQIPAASATVTGLTSITITFSKPVTGVDASDVLLNGSPLANVSGSGSNYTFSFPQPPYGVVTVRWATNHGIHDLEVPPDDFDPTRPGHIWSYALVDPVPTVTIISPTNNAYMLAPANVPLRASATDNDGTIARVEYFEAFEDYKIGEATTSPYTVIWSNRVEGFYGIRAVATDNSGLMATSAPVVINVVTSLPVLLVRGPYLQSGSTTGAVVRWRTDQVSDAIVRWGPDWLHLTNLAVQTIVTNEHTVQVSGLQPATKYFYSISTSIRTLAGGTNFGGSNFWFNTHPPTGTTGPTRFWVLGDPGTANANQRAVRDSYYNFVANGERPADFWLMLGDNAYNSGTDTEYQGAVFDMYPDTLRNYFLWPVLGNHESAQSTSTTVTFPYLDIFSTPQNGEAGGLPSGNPKYYSFDYANVHFIALDSMTSGRATNSPMVLWLQDDLANNMQPWTIVYFHHSLYTKGTHDSDSESDLVQMRQNFNPIFEANGVDLVLMGHSHVYERSYLLDGHYGLSSTFTASMKINGGDGRMDGTGAYRKDEEGRGVVYTINGSSGQALGGPLNHPAHVVSLNLLGSSIIDVNSNRLDAIFLTSAGTTNDHYTLIKRGPAPSVPVNLTAEYLATNQIRLSWGDIATNELGYIIERASDCVNFVKIATNAPNTTQFIDTGLPANMTYCYRVRSFNSESESVPSNAATGSTSVPRPVLAARVNALNGARSLTVSGVTGMLFMIEKTTNLSDASSWKSWQPVTLSNASQIIDLGPNTNGPTIFYRTKQ